METQFLEFFGNLLINAAKGRKQMDELARWINPGFESWEGQKAVSRKFYGLNDPNGESPDFPKEWKNAADGFQKSLNECLDVMGVVSKEEHLKLVGKYEDLKEKAADLEETIKHLKLLLDEKGMAREEVHRGFQDLIKRQNDQFQDLMKGSWHLLEKKSNGMNDNNNS